MKFIFIEGNVPSSKNSRAFNIKARRSFPSKTTSSYIRKTVDQWKDNKEMFFSMIEGLPKPYKVAMFFSRDSRRRFDANNASQIVTDLMAKNGWIGDDKMSEIWPVFIGFDVDKSKPGVYISVLNEDYNKLIEHYVKKLNENGR